MMGRHNNQLNDGFGGGWAFKRRWNWAKRVGEDVYSLFWVANCVTIIMKIESAMGPYVSMASFGWGNATTNQKSVTTIGYS